MLFNEYHVENSGTSTGLTFPTECTTGASLSPQEKLLEFSLFELTDDGGSATLTPDHADFGSENVGFATGPQTFTWTNHSTFTSGVTLLNASGDFVANSSNCTTVKGGDSCTITVVFAPTALGARTGVLSVGSGAQTLTAQLTGNGIPGLVLTPASLTFGSIDVGGSQTLQATIMNQAPAALPLPSIVMTGDYSATTNCPNSVGAGSELHDFCDVLADSNPDTCGHADTERGLRNAVDDADGDRHGLQHVDVTGFGNSNCRTCAGDHGEPAADFRLCRQSADKLLDNRTGHELHGADAERRE